jgi:hypothetical protein
MSKRKNDLFLKFGLRQAWPLYGGSAEKQSKEVLLPQTVIGEAASAASNTLLLKQGGCVSGEPRSFAARRFDE